jgi:hypothetical protein
MIYIDREGNLCQRTSESIADSTQDVLSPRVTSEFLRAVARSRESQGTHFQGEPFDFIARIILTWYSPYTGTI